MDAPKNQPQLQVGGQLNPRAGQVAGLVGLIISLTQTNLLHFAGLGQAVRYLSGERDIDPPAELVTTGTYSLVRHPLYFFSMMILWLMPDDLYRLCLQCTGFNLLPGVITSGRTAAGNGIW